VHHNGHGSTHHVRHVHGPRQIIWDDNRHGLFIPRAALNDIVQQHR
jgi:hypothetical protein